MFFSHYLFALCVAVTIASPVTRPRDGSKRVAYFLDNNPAGNDLVALEISDTDGTLSSPVMTSTGRLGLAGLLAISQDSVKVVGNYLFTVNACSDTISMFIIDENDPLHPKLVGEPQSTNGNTPVSVAYSPLLGTANAGVTSGVTCYTVDPVKGLSQQGPLRFIPQTEDADPTTPAPPGPLVLVSDLIFNPSSTALFAAVRSNGGQPGLIYVWPVVNNTITTTPIVSSFPMLPLVFSFAFLNSDFHLFVTNPHLDSPGAAFLTVLPSFEITMEKVVTIPNQAASCSVGYSSDYDSVFVIDAAIPNITLISPESGDVQGVVPFETPTFGGQDSIVNRNWLYMLTVDPNAPKILVFDISPIANGGLPVEVQSFDIFGAVGVIPNEMGLSIYPSEQLTT